MLSMAEAKAIYASKGGCFFTPNNMRFFSSRICCELYPNRCFVTSEVPPDSPRVYSVRRFAEDYGDIKTVGAHGGYATLADAKRAARAAAPDMLSALELAERNATSRLYRLPINADATERKSLETERAIYAAAIAKATGE